MLAEYDGKLVKIVFDDGDCRKALVGYILDVINDKIKVMDRTDKYHMIDLLVIRRISEYAGKDA
jgi:hypothetical protein